MNFSFKTVSIFFIAIITLSITTITNAQKSIMLKAQDCFEQYESKLLDFESNNGYKIPDAKLVHFENEDAWFVGRVTQSAKAFSSVPERDGTPVATFWVRPKSEGMREEIKEGVYQMSLVPIKGIKNAAQLAVRPGSKTSFLPSPQVTTTFQGVVMNKQEAQQLVWCDPNRVCPTVSAAIIQQYQALADNNCVIYEVSARCQIQFTAVSSCFWKSNWTEVVSPKSSNCTNPPTVVRVWAF